MRYLLEDVLLFDEDQGTLQGITSGKSTKLPYAAVLLLKVLCDNNQIMLTRETLMDKAWTENGLRASGSNLYNSLSLIRKSVESVDVDLKIIRTQPKVGLIMEASVTRLDEPEPSKNSTSNTSGDEHAGGADPTILTATQPEPVNGPAPELNTPLPSFESPSSAQTVVREKPAKQGRLFSFKKWGTGFYFIWSVLILIILIVGQGGAFFADKGPDLSTQQHFRMGTYQQCTLYRLDDVSDAYPGKTVDEKIKLLARDYKINCESTRVEFYVHSKSNAHFTYSDSYQMTMVCVYNKVGHEAISCFNDFLQKRRQ